jgi:hypothetical protein
MSQGFGIKIGSKLCFNHWINLISPISMQLIFHPMLFSNLDANLMIETKLGTNFGPNGLGN